MPQETGLKACGAGSSFGLKYALLLKISNGDKIGRNLECYRIQYYLDV